MFEPTPDHLGFVTKSCTRCEDEFDSLHPGTYELCSACSLDDEAAVTAELQPMESMPLFPTEHDGSEGPNIPPVLKEEMKMERKEKVEDLVPIESGRDLREFDGRKVKIESIEIATVSSKFTSNGEAEILRVKSQKLGTLTDREGAEVNLHASSLFRLKRNKDGKLGWPKSDRSKLTRFMAQVGVTLPAELVGCTVAVRVVERSNGDGLPRQFLELKTD